MSCVVSVIATYRRAKELARLLASLREVDGVVVCNNGADESVRKVCAQASTTVICLDSPTNLGCGAGLRLAEETAWKRFGDQMTHLLVLDDDAVLEPDTVPRLLGVLDREKAAVVYPLIINADGGVGWTPGLKNSEQHKVGRTAIPVQAYRDRLGARFPEFTWAQGICLLARREAVDEAGFHRADFWVRGEDLDFSLRLTSQGRGVFATDVVVKHLPPDELPALAGPAEYLRHAAMIQNIAYLVVRQAHGRRIAASLPGAARRFLGNWGITAAPDLVRAIWRGAVCAEPAGAGEGRTFRRRFDELANR